jgi:ribosomal protein S9
MQTTLRMDDELFRKAKARAAVSGQSLTEFLEEAVRARLQAPLPSRKRAVRLPVSKARGGYAGRARTLREAVAAADLADDSRERR